MPQVAKLERQTKNVKFLSVQVIHGMGMAMMSNASKGKAGQSSASEKAADLKRDSGLTEKILKKAGGALTYVLDQPGGSTPFGKTAGEYGAFLGTWVLLSRDRRLVASGHDLDTLNKSLRSL